MGSGGFSSFWQNSLNSASFNAQGVIGEWLFSYSGCGTKPPPDMSLHLSFSLLDWPEVSESASMMVLSTFSDEALGIGPVNAGAATDGSLD